MSFADLHHLWHLRWALIATVGTISLSEVTFASSQGDPIELRLIVTFKNESSVADRNRLYAGEDAKIIETFPSIGADLILISRKKNPRDAQEEEIAQQICERLKAHKTFISCEPDRKLQIHSETVTCRGCGALTSPHKKATSVSVEPVKCEVEPVAGLQDPQTGRDAGKDGKWNVSPLWGQRAIGADLAAEMTLRNLQAGKIKRVPIGNIDIIDVRPPHSPVDPKATKFDLLPVSAGEGRQHGNVTSDLVDKPPFGVSPAVTWTFLANLASNVKGSAAWNSSLIRSLELAATSEARLVTASVGYFGSAPHAAIDYFVSSRKIYVQSAGNNYPIPALGGPKPFAGQIVVGSVGPNGLPTPFSQEPVKIYAPADGAQLSGPKETFGGTSGAAPLVSGSLANALAALPGLTNEEVEILLKRTSLPAFGTKGPGIVNAYRLAVVADCLGDDWPTSRALLSEVNSNPEKCFDQKKLAKTKLEAANRLLFNGSGCEAKRDGLKALRASHLLAPTSLKALQLSRIYKDLGFRGDARWYETMAASLGSEADQRQHFLVLLREPSLAVHRYFAGSTLDASSRGAYAMTLASRLPETHEFVKLAQADVARLASSANPADRLEAVERAGFLGPYAVPFVFPALEKSREFSNRRAAGPFFNRLTIADGVPNPWEPILRERLKNTPFADYLE